MRKHINFTDKQHSALQLGHLKHKGDVLIATSMFNKLKLITKIIRT
jgi:hypothetical protein